MSNVPKLRFPEFEGEWEELKFKDLYDVTSSKRVYQAQWKSKGIPFYRAREIAIMSEGGHPSNIIYISETLYDEYACQFGAIAQNDILITGVGTLGKAYVVKSNDRFYFKDGNIIWFKNKNKANSIFIKMLFSIHSVTKQIIDNAGGSTVGTYTIEGAKNTKVTIPRNTEQAKIADFFTLIVNKITKQDEKVAALEHYKKGLMHKIFSREIRFKDDHGKDYPEWEEKLFGDIFKYFPTYSYSRAMLSDIGSIMYIHYGDIHTKYSSILDVGKADLPYMKNNFNVSVVPEVAFCKNGDLLIADASEDYDAIGKATVLINVDNNRIIGGLHTILARDVQNMMTSTFRGYMIASDDVQSQIRIIAVGAKVLGISKTSLSDINLKVPTLHEQTKIANFLSLYDRKIEKEKAKLESLREQKKGLMQSMFV